MEPVELWQKNSPGRTKNVLPCDKDDKAKEVQNSVMTNFEEYERESYEFKKAAYDKYRKLTCNAIEPGEGLASSPVILYGDPNLTCAEWYDHAWEQAHAGLHSLERLPIDPEIEILEKESLAEYLTAILYLRWAIVADIEIEPELMDIIESTLSKTKYENPECKPTEPVPFPHNDEDLVFEEDDLMGAYLAKELDAAASLLSSGSFFVHQGDICYNAGEYPGTHRPVFKASGWDTTVRAMKSEIGLPFSCIASSGIEMFAITDVQRTLRRPIPSDDFDDVKTVGIKISEADSIFDDDSTLHLAPSRTAMILIDDEESALRLAWQTVTLLDLAEQLPHDIDNVIVPCVSTNPRCIDFCLDYAKRHGIEILVSFVFVNSGADAAVDTKSSVLTDAKSSQNSFDDTPRYVDEVPSAIIEKVHQVKAIHAARRFNRQVWMHYEAEPDEHDLSFEDWKPLSEDEERARDAEHVRRLDEILSCLSFGTINLEGIDPAYAADTLSNKLLSDLALREDVGEGELAKDIDAMEQMYLRYDALSPDLDSIEFTEEETAIFRPYKIGWKGKYGERWQREEAIEHARSCAEEIGLDEFFAAYKRGIPMEDLLCGAPEVPFDFYM